MTIIEEIKAEVERLKIPIPRSSAADGYNMAIADVLSIIEEKSENSRDTKDEQESYRRLVSISTDEP